jgi:hypothetical protein
MLKIDRKSDGETTVISLIGRIQSGHLDELNGQMEDAGPRLVLDLNDVTLVDVEVVRFLSTRESDGIELAHCPAYVREWILRERAEGG